MAKYKVIEQFGRAPKLELAFMKDGRPYAYLIPADPHMQECFDVMKEVKRLFNKGLRTEKRKQNERGKRQ